MPLRWRLTSRRPSTTRGLTTGTSAASTAGTGTPTASGTGPSEITAGDPGLPRPVLRIGGMTGMATVDMVPGPKMTTRRVTTAR